LNRNLFLIVLVFFVGYVGMALPYPILAPLFLESETNLTTGYLAAPSVLLGIVLATYPLGLLVGSFFLGKYSDSYGRKKLLVQTLAGAVLANLLSAWAIATENLPVLIIARLFTGLFEGNISIARAMITDLELKITKAEAFGYLSAAGYAGYLVGPLLSGLLVTISQQLPFIIASVMSAAALIVALLWMSETKIHHSSKSVHSVVFWQTPHLFKFIFIQFLMCFAVSSFYNYFPVLMVDKFQSTSQAISYATISCTLAMLLVSTLGMKSLVRHWNIAQLYFGGMLLFSGTMALTIFPTRESLAYICFAACGSAIALQNSNASTWFSEYFYQLQQGKLQGTLVSTFCLANITSSVMGGYLSSLTVDSVMLLGAICALTASLGFKLLNPTSRTKLSKIKSLGAYDEIE